MVHQQLQKQIKQKISKIEQASAVYTSFMRKYSYKLSVNY